MIELKPCPFCGEEEELEVSDEYGSYWLPIAVRCENCGTLGPPADSFKGAKEEWNMRREKEK